MSPRPARTAFVVSQELSAAYEMFCKTVQGSRAWRTWRRRVVQLAMELGCTN